MPLHPLRASLNDEKNYGVLRDFLKRVSYKPGWNIVITQDQNNYGFTVTVTYEGYESENAAFTPLAPENPQVTVSRARLTRKTLRQPEKRYFRREFDMYTLENMTPENLIKYVIGDTIKQAEMFEFDRWFKVDGYVVSGKD
jgi:hypothetical protein